MEKRTSSIFLRLPESKEEKQQLKKSILELVQKLEEKQSQNVSSAEKIQTLQLRLNLIQSCSQMSIMRLDHLEQIFKHYCTHIFRTGKHMTFDRLQYEKVHLTMDRFFLFVKDFDLISMEVNGKNEEIIEKNTVIFTFKKISSNAKDLTFEQFITCLEKIALLYYNQKLVYFDKIEKKKKQKEKRRKQVERKRRLIEKNKKKKPGEQGEENAEEEEQEEEKQDEKQEEKQEKQEEKQKQEIKASEKDEQKQDKQDNEEDEQKQNENDDQQGEEIRKNNFALSSRMKTKTKNKFKEVQLFELTNEEKIQYYYKFIIRVDNVVDYRKRMTELSYPTFLKEKMKSSEKMEQKNNKSFDDPQSSRIQQLKKKIGEKKSKQKNLAVLKPQKSYAWQKIQLEKKRKRQIKKQREEKAKIRSKEQSDALIQKKYDVKRAEKERLRERERKNESFSEKQIDLKGLGQLSIDQLRIKLNPQKFYSRDEQDDKMFLQQYETRRYEQGFPGMQRQSVSIVENMKKRVNQIEKNEKKHNKDLENFSKKLGLNIPIKNRF